MQTASIDLQMDRQEQEIKKTFNTIDHATFTTVAFTTLANTDNALELMLRLETTLNRMYTRALKTLQEIQNIAPDPRIHQHPKFCETTPNQPDRRTPKTTNRS
jgi:hypothetical protein